MYDNNCLKQTGTIKSLIAIGRKDCRSNEFVWQKLNYIHNNPCTGKWQLAINPIEYLQNPVIFYLKGVQGVYPVTNFMEKEDINFNIDK